MLLLSFCPFLRTDNEAPAPRHPRPGPGAAFRMQDGSCWWYGLSDMDLTFMEAVRA